MTFPSFSAGEVLRAQDMNAVGMWLVKTQSVVGTPTSVVVTGAFSADYDNYVIKLSGFTSATGGTSIALRLNNSSGTTYLMGGSYANLATTTLIGYGPAASTSWTDIGALDTAASNTSIELFNPFLTARTTFSSTSVRSGSVSNTWYNFLGVDTAAVSNTGFSVFPVAGGATFTAGTIRVYGYRN